MHISRSRCYLECLAARANGSLKLALHPTPGKVGDALDDLDLVVEPFDQIRSEGPSAMSQNAWWIGL